MPDMWDTGGKQSRRPTLRFACYLAAQHHLGLASVPGKDEAPRQNLCSSTYPSLLSGKKEYQRQYSSIASSINCVQETNMAARQICIKIADAQLHMPIYK